MMKSIWQKKIKTIQMIAEKIAFNKIAKERSLRFDIDYVSFNSKLNFDNSISFLDLLEVVEKSKVNIDDLDEFNYAEISDVNKTGEVTPNKLSFNNRNEFNESYFKKIEKGDIILPFENDILISSVRPNLKKFVLVNEGENIYYTRAFIQLRPKQFPEILYYTLREIFFENLIVVSRQGKGYPILKGEDLRYIKFEREIIEKLISKQKEILPLIKGIKAETKKLKVQIKPDTEIINEVFNAKFGWDTKTFDELKNVHIMNCTFSAFTNNIDNRFSFKFHNKAGAYVSKILKSQTSKRIKDFLADDITLGKSISPSDYNENGEQYYVSMADIKNWLFETEEARTVSQSYFDANPNKRIALNDIIMARSGEGTIGKVAIIDNEENEAVYADFTMRIRLKDYNPTFAYYYFRTNFFQYLIYTHKKGLGNNTNIFPNQIKEFPLPDISEKQQFEIVTQIQTSINEQRKIESLIKNKQRGISGLIEKAIRDSAISYTNFQT